MEKDFLEEFVKKAVEENEKREDGEKRKNTFRKSEEKRFEKGEQGSKYHP